MDENLDENEIRDLEEVLRTKIYPGTEIMKDVAGHHFVKAGGGSRDVLVPQPSDDPHDPLNWSPLWKNLAIFSATTLSFSLNLGPLALAPMFTSYVEEWDRSLADVVQFTGVAILCLGFSNFIWVPIMVCFGRRPVAIFSVIICVGSSVWRAVATSYDSFMGACILNGLSAGPCETLMPQVIADIIFLHDRGKYQTLYFSLYFISLMVGPVISGAMAEIHGWRSFWWFNTALLIFTLIVNVLFFPETRYRRPLETIGAKAARDPARAGGDGATAAGSGGCTAPKDASISKNEGDDAIQNDTAILQEVDKGKADVITGKPNGEANGNNAGTNGGGLGHPVTHQDPYLGRGTPSKAQFLPLQRYDGNIIRELWLPLYLHIFPIVEFAAFVVSWSASGFLVVNLSQSQAFAAPPYNYSSQTIGLFNLAVLVGGLIGLVTCGPASDWVAARLTARNGGVREPEMRLITMIPYVLVMILGSIVVAVGYDRHWPWQAIVIVGYGCLGVQVSALPSIASTYAIDSYKPITGSMFVTITINKNLWGYGVSKFLTPWSEESGFMPPILLNMALITIFSACGIIFWFWGKQFRGLSSKSFVHSL